MEAKRGRLYIKVNVTDIRYMPRKGFGEYESAVYVQRDRQIVFIVLDLEIMLLHFHSTLIVLVFGLTLAKNKQKVPYFLSLCKNVLCHLCSHSSFFSQQFFPGGALFSFT